MKFSGWVPTVTGNLSFSVIGNGTFPSKCIRTDFANGFSVLQRRDLLDVLVPYAEDNSFAQFFREKLVNWIWRISGKFSFLFIADDSKGDNEVCHGKIFIIAEALEKKKLKELRAWLNTEKRDVSVLEAEKILLDSHIYSAEIMLERQGKVTISAKKLPDAANSDKNNPNKIDFFLANQAFYFLKDICHVHQHHDPRHDAITELTDTNDEEHAWKADTHHALYRAIIRYKRFRNEKALFRASGVLAYTKAFQNNYLKNDDSQKIFSYDELEQSLQVSRAELQHFDQKRLAKIETFKNFFFGLFGLAVSVSYLSRLKDVSDIPVNEQIIVFATILAQYPFQVVGITILFSLFWMVVTHQIDPADSALMRWFTRMFQSFRLRYYILANILLTAIFSWLCYMLLSFSI